MPGTPPPSLHLDTLLASTHASPPPLPAFPDASATASPSARLAVDDVLLYESADTSSPVSLPSAPASGFFTPATGPDAFEAFYRLREELGASQQERIKLKQQLHLERKHNAERLNEAAQDHELALRTYGDALASANPDDRKRFAHFKAHEDVFGQLVSSEDYFHDCVAFRTELEAHIELIKAKQARDLEEQQERDRIRMREE